MPRKKLMPPKSQELQAAEKLARKTLLNYFKSVPGRQQQLAEQTGIWPESISRMAHGHTQISVEAALRIEVATAGQLKATQLCPAAAAILAAYKTT